MGIAKVAKEGLASPVARGMVDFFTRSVWEVGFARSLGFYDDVQVTSFGQQGNSMEAVFTVPENICTKSGRAEDRGGAYLPCGVSTALFDEISTLAMVVADKTFRPGVSISLSCHMFHPVGPGERVTFKSRGLKMGARLGYGEASMYREDGKLAARGRHLKHLPMGRAWDLATIPVLHPLARKLFDRRHERWIQNTERTKGIPPGGHLLDMFALEDFDRYDGEGLEVSGDRQSYRWQNNEDGFRSAEAELPVSKSHINYVPGTMHGGAIAVAAEEIARRCPPSPVPLDSLPLTGHPRVQYMEVHYMSPIKRRAALSAVSAAAGTGTDETRVGLSEAGGTDGGVLCAEAVLIWGQGDDAESR